MQNLKFFSIAILRVYLLLSFSFFIFSLSYYIYDFVQEDKNYIFSSPPKFQISLQPSNAPNDIIHYNFSNQNIDLDEEELDSKSIVVFNTSTHQFIYQKNPHTQTKIASITKLVSTSVINDNLNYDDVITLKNIEDISGSSIELQNGEKYTAYNLFKAALIQSSNQAIYGINPPEDTVRQMNEFISALGLKDSNFTNPAGFDDDSHYSSASDLIYIALHFQKQSNLYELTQITEDSITEISSGRKIDLLNTNDLLILNTQGVEAGKTGTTPMSGQNLLLYYNKNDVKYIIVLLNSTDRYQDAYKIIENIP